jgi:hypothetical protein
MVDPQNPPEGQDIVLHDAITDGPSIHLNRMRGIVEIGIKNGSIEDQDEYRVNPVQWVHVNIKDLLDALGQLEVL